MKRAMDFSALSLQKLNREKRERQPNWTESEKQLLLSFTQLHKHILENKGSDTMTIKRKSQAWDDIAERMKAAGFNRSKERLKQQLGRIRSADAKRCKHEMEKCLTTERVDPLNDSGNHSMFEENNCLNSHCRSTLATPFLLKECDHIQSEKASSVDKNDSSQQEIQINSRCYIKPNIINYSIINSCKSKTNDVKCQFLDNKYFEQKNVPQLIQICNNVDTESKFKDLVSESKGKCAADVSSTIPCSSVPANIKQSVMRFASNQISNNVNKKNASCSFSSGKLQLKQRVKRISNLRSSRSQTLFTREQGLRQLCMYRVAVERERLRSLKLQEKRDRILYRKDVEIQNLKLEILRNLNNQNRDLNNINF